MLPQLEMIHISQCVYVVFITWSVFVLQISLFVYCSYMYTLCMGKFVPCNVM